MKTNGKKRVAPKQARAAKRSRRSAPPVPRTPEPSQTPPTLRPKPQVAYEEPLPFIPYRPGPTSSPHRRASAVEAYTPDRGKLQEVLRLADEAAAALRAVAGPDYNTDVAIRARLSALANHLEEVARYMTRAYR